MERLELGLLGQSNSKTEIDLIYLDKCAVCQQPASKACGSCELEFYCCKEHQKLHWKRHKTNCSSYIIRKHDAFGLCMVATKPIKAGYMIASECPIAVYSDEIVNEGKNLQKVFSISDAFPFSCPSCELGKVLPHQFHRCSNCGIPLCKELCQELGNHRDNECRILQEQGVKETRDISSLRDILADVTVLRLLLKEDRKGCPLSFENKKWRSLLKKVFIEKMSGDSGEKHKVSIEIIKSLKAVVSLPLSVRFCDNRELMILLHCALKSYGIPFLKENRRRFLYTKNQWLSHSCSPNAEMWIDNQEKYYTLIIKATRPIKTGQRITVNMGGKLISLPTSERRKKLQELFGIDCRCKRCRDPTELGTFVSAIRCEESASSKGCYGHYLPKDPLNDTAVWKCSVTSCKSFKTCTEIQQIVWTAERELPSVSGQADVVLKRFRSFLEYFSGDILYSHHYLICTAMTRMRQVVKYFLGTGEKLFLCVVNDYPRAYEFCSILLKSIEAMKFIVDKINPLFNETRAKLLYEKAVVEFAVAIYECTISRVQTIRSVVRKSQEALKDLKEAATAISIYSHTVTLQDNINFFGSVIKKIFRGFLTPTDCLQPSNQPFEALEQALKKRIEETWKNRSMEVGLLTFYMEPFSSVNTPSNETLRKIILSD